MKTISTYCIINFSSLVTVFSVYALNLLYFLLYFNNLLLVKK